jgi:hypothetical protein
MAQFTRENFKITIFMVTAPISGLMKEFIKDFGRIIRCMEKAFLLGKMVEGMRESISKIK